MSSRRARSDTRTAPMRTPHTSAGSASACATWLPAATKPSPTGSTRSRSSTAKSVPGTRDATRGGTTTTTCRSWPASRSTSATSSWDAKSGRWPRSPGCPCPWPSSRSAAPPTRTCACASRRACSSNRAGACGRFTSCGRSRRERAWRASRSRRRATSSWTSKATRSRVRGAASTCSGSSPRARTAPMSTKGSGRSTTRRSARYSRRVMDRIAAASAAHPGMHVYHYAPYEPSAFKRLMGRYATRGDALDVMLREGRFVDLYGVVRQGLLAGIERYSIKNLEVFYGYDRAVALPSAGRALRRMEQALELKCPDAAPPEVRDLVEGYNRDDCVSTLRLRDWLEGRRAQLEASGTPVPRPAVVDGAAPEKVDERARRVAVLRERLLAGVPDAPTARDAEQKARWTLAYLLDWHRREDKAGWWEYYRLRDLPEEDLFDEPQALAGLQVVERVGEVTNARTGKPTGSVIDRYRYPPQEMEIRDEDELKLKDGKKYADVCGVDRKAMTIDIRKGTSKADLHASAAFAHNHVNTGVLEEAIERIADQVAEDGRVSADGGHANPLAGPLLMAAKPRLRGGAVRDEARRESRRLRRPVGGRPRSHRARHPGAAGVGEDLHRGPDDLRAHRAGTHGRHHRHRPQGHPQPPRGGGEGGGQVRRDRPPRPEDRRRRCRRARLRHHDPRRQRRSTGRARVRHRERARRHGLALGAAGVRARGRRPLRGRSGTDGPRQRARGVGCGGQHRPARRSAAAGPAAEGEPSRRRRGVRAGARPGRAAHHSPGPRHLPARDLAARAEHLRVHVGALL